MFIFIKDNEIFIIFNQKYYNILMIRYVGIKELRDVFLSAYVFKNHLNQFINKNYLKVQFTPIFF